MNKAKISKRVTLLTNIFKKAPNIKKNNVIHLNVYTELFIEHAKQIKQHIEMLIRMYLDLDVEEFKMLMHELNVLHSSPTTSSH